jgi:hypothetical protein
MAFVQVPDDVWFFIVVECIPGDLSNLVLEDVLFPPRGLRLPYSLGLSLTKQFI